MPIQLIFAIVSLMGLFAALWPEKYARYFLTKSQREMMPADLKGLALTGWGLFIFGIVGVVAIAFPQVWVPHGKLIEVVMLLGISVAWAWWGIGLMRRPESFRRGTLARWSVWGIKLFGVVLLIGAAGLACQFIMKVEALLR